VPETDNSSPSSVDFKNDWIYTSIAPICFRRVCSATLFTFTFTFTRRKPLIFVHTTIAYMLRNVKCEIAKLCV
jgi:hypothetical protein